MSQEQNKDKLPATSGTTTGTTETPEDKSARDSVERRVVEHIVRMVDDKKQDTQKPPEVSDRPEDLLRRLKDAETARAQAEAELNKVTGEKKTAVDELTQRRSQLEALALKEFEDKKRVLVESVRADLGDEKAEEVAESIKTGQDIASTERWITIFKDTFKSKDTKGAEGTGNQTQGTPEIKTTTKGKLAGRAPALVIDSALPTFDTTEDLVNHVYDTLEEQMYLRAMEKPYDANKLQKYENYAQKLVKSLITGEKSRNRIQNIMVTQCRTCGKILTGGENKCTSCGKPILLESRGV